MSQHPTSHHPTSQHPNSCLLSQDKSRFSDEVRKPQSAPAVVELQTLPEAGARSGCISKVSNFLMSGAWLEERRVRTESGLRQT